MRRTIDPATGTLVSSSRNERLGHVDSLSSSALGVERGIESTSRRHANAKLRPLRASRASGFASPERA